MTQKWWVLSAVACGTFMATLDSSIVNIALPTLTQQLNADIDHVKWVVIVYLLVITCLLLPFGLLSDQRGRKPIFQSGFIIFVIGSALCGFASDLSVLVFFRGLQAMGGAMLMANGPAIITKAFPARERGAALGTLAMVVSAGLVMGPSLGGSLISNFGWQSIFWVNIPIGLMGTFLAQRFVKREEPQHAHLSFDWMGALLQTAFLILFMVLFDSSKTLQLEHGIHPSKVLILFALVMISVLFIYVEKRAAVPLFDLSLLKNRTFSASNLAGFLTFVAFSSVYVLMPFFFEEQLHYLPTQAGLLMTSIPVTIFIVAPISGRLSDRFGSTGLSLVGALVGAFGLFLMAGVVGPGLTQASSSWMIVFFLFLIGLAQGLFQSPNNSSIMESVPTQKLGVASAFTATVRNLGWVTGTGLATGIFSWRLESTGDFISAFQFTFLIASLIAIGAMVAASGKVDSIRGRVRK